MKAKSASESQFTPGRLLQNLGLLVVVGSSALVVLGLTLVYPPWTEVHCQRRQVLYWSERKQVYERSFAGFDYLLAKDKWQSTSNPPNPSSDTFFDSREFQLCWPLLAAEWGLILGGAGAAYYRLSRRYVE